VFAVYRISEWGLPCHFLDGTPGYFSMLIDTAGISGRVIFTACWDAQNKLSVNMSK